MSHQRALIKKRRNYFRDNFDKLQGQRAALKQQLADAAGERSGLQFKDNILQAWLECLNLLQAEALQSESSSDSELQQQHHKLLQLLNQSESVESSSDELPCTDPLLQTIGPPGDPLALFRDLTSRPSAPGVETLTALQYLEQHRDLALQLGTQLYLLDHSIGSRQSALDSIKRLLERHYHVMWSLIYCGKLDVVEATKVFNLESRELLSPDSPLVDNQESIKTDVVPALGLSEQQQAAIAHTMEVCESLMAPIVREIKHLQQQLDASISIRSGISNIDSSGVFPPAGSIKSISSSSQSAAAGNAPPTAKELLEKQQKLLARLQVVLKKQYHVVAATTSIFLSQLTWVQAAKMVVHRWPYTASMQYVAKAVWQHRKEQLQQQRAETCQTGGRDGKQQHKQAR